jgi:hypothetical protein
MVIYLLGCWIACIIVALNFGTKTREIPVLWILFWVVIYSALSWLYVVSQVVIQAYFAVMYIRTGRNLPEEIANRFDRW